MVSKPTTLLLLGAQRDRHFLYSSGVVPVSVVFYSASYCETAELMATFNPHDFSGAANLTLPGYQIECRNVHLDLHLHAYRRAVRGDDEHPA